MMAKEVFKQLLEEKENNTIKKPSKDYITRIDNLITNSITFIKKEEYNLKATYKNSKDEINELTISKHALKQFIKRLKLIYNKDLSDVNFESLLCYMINLAVRENLDKCKKLNHRRNTHAKGKYSVYLKYGCFRFVICNVLVVTTEIRGQYNYLNKEN